jgi:hypothetical protein
MLQALASTKVEGRRIAVLGEMLELARRPSTSMIRAAGRGPGAGIDWLAVGGPAADGYLAGAIAAGIPRGAHAALSGFARGGAPSSTSLGGRLVLVKGSRGTKTDVIADALKAAGGRNAVLPPPRILRIYLLGQITFRTAAASLTAVRAQRASGSVADPPPARVPSRPGDPNDGPATHKPKAGHERPWAAADSGGGVHSRRCYGRTFQSAHLVAVIATASFGAIGFVDDYLKITRHTHHGLFAALQIRVPDRRGHRCRIALVYMSHWPQLYNTQLSFHSSRQLHPDLGWWYVAFAVLVLVATTNTVNLTDGLDGLAISTFAVSAPPSRRSPYVTGHAAIANFLLIPHYRIHE